MIPACIFAKPFEPGRVKTRLAYSIGPDAAAELAAAMFRDVWAAVSSSVHARPVLATTGIADFGIPIDLRDIWLQGEGDLGKRLERILGRGLQSTSAVLAVGADCPVLSAGHIDEAAHCLGHHDAVVGRCHDGGFYLLGLKRCPPGLFSQLPWSTERAAAAVVERLFDNGFRVGEISPLFDVDVPDDFDWLLEALGRDPSIAPATRRWLAVRALIPTEQECDSASSSQL